MTSYVIIGGGLAAARSAEELRDLDGEARIVVVAGEPVLPYERPPLSKDYLMGKSDFAQAVPLDQYWYSDNQVQLRLNTFATGVDRQAKLVHLADGSSLSYDALVLATGSRPRTLTVEGIGRPGVQTLRTVEESTQLREALTPDARLVIIGGGWIAFEVASSARQLGAQVTVLVRGDQVLRELGPTIAGRFCDLHRDHGVDIRLNSQAEAIEGQGDAGPVAAVRLSDGTRLPADHVLLALGAEPRLDLAAQAGLELADGVVVDDQLRSSDPAIVAVGDIANAHNDWLGRRVRLAHWAAAQNQPAVAARTLVGDQAHWDDLPYFFTDQYDWGMEFRGAIGEGGSQVQRGHGTEYLYFWLDGHSVPTAVMNLNLWDQGDAIEALLRVRRPVDPARLADPDQPLASLLD